MPFGQEGSISIEAINEAQNDCYTGIDILMAFNMLDTDIVKELMWKTQSL